MTLRVAVDPEDRWRLVRVSTDLLGQFGTRTERGERITAEWGEPDADGVYEPTFTVHPDTAHSCYDPETLAAAATATYEHWAGEHLAPATCSFQDHVDAIADAIGRPASWPKDVRAALEARRAGGESG